MKRFGHGGARWAICGAMLLAQGCNFSSGWTSKSYRDGASGSQVTIATHRFKRDKVAIGASARCVAPNKLTLEFVASEDFRIADARGRKVIPYSLGLNGHAPVALEAGFASPNTLIIPRTPGQDSKGAPLDLSMAKNIVVQFHFANGATSIDFHSSDPGISDAFTACGFDPAAMALRVPQGTDAPGPVQRPATALNGEAAVKPVTLATLSGQWECSGDIGDFTFGVDNYRYMFSDDSPWGTLSGRVSIGAREAGVDGSAVFPLLFEDSPWDGASPPWSYSPLGPGGTIYYISVQTGQSARCVRAH